MPVTGDFIKMLEFPKKIIDMTMFLELVDCQQLHAAEGQCCITKKRFLYDKLLQQSGRVYLCLQLVSHYIRVSNKVAESIYVPTAGESLHQGEQQSLQIPQF